MSFSKFSNFGVESRVRSHSSTQLEIKLEYNLEDLVKNNNYKIETYFFIPEALKINKSTYPKKKFYADIKNYIRFMNPRFPLAKMIDPDFSQSPLAKLEKILSRFSVADDKEQEKLREKSIKELKLLGTMVKARLSDWQDFIIKKTKSQANLDAQILKNLEERINNSCELLNLFRKINKDFANSVPKEEIILKYFKIIEEFISNIIEEKLSFTLLLIEKNYNNPKELDNIKNQFNDFFKKEHSLRENNKFKFVLSDTEEGREKYIQYLNQYKKAISSVLHLDVARKEKDATYAQIIATWAAFISALINFYIAFYIIQNYAANTILFIILMTSLYVFKDRVKDFLKLAWQPNAISRLPDHQNTITVQKSDKKIKIGIIKEKIIFALEKNIDPKVLDIKEKILDFLPFAKIIRQSIMVYYKEISIKTKVIKKLHSRTINLTDITRFNLNSFFVNMESPKKEIYYWDEKKYKVGMAEGERIYYLGLILKHTKLSKGEKKLHYEAYRLDCTRAGIKNIENLSDLNILI